MWWILNDHGHHQNVALCVSRLYGLNSHQRPMYISVPSADMMCWYGVSLARAMSQSAIAGRAITLARIRQKMFSMDGVLCRGMPGAIN